MKDVTEELQLVTVTEEVEIIEEAADVKEPEGESASRGASKRSSSRKT
jgi:hypothetical protein